MTIPRRAFLALSGAGIVALGRPGMAAHTQIVGGPAFGSWWRASLPPDCDASAIQTAIHRVIDEIDASMSPFRAGSELCRLNLAPPGQWLEISSTIAPVIDESLRVARMTDGAFDPTVGPLVGQLGFGPIAGSTAATYQSLDTGHRRLMKTTSGATLDLCGLAKGRALDRMAQVAVSFGAQSFLIEAGGEVLARGRHPAGRPWLVAIETPAATPPAASCIVRLDDGQALATSGPALQGGTGAGYAFNHIVDARTSRPVANTVASVSVIAASAMHADAMATALVVMGPEIGLELARSQNLAVLFQLREGAGLIQSMSAGFARQIET